MVGEHLYISESCKYHAVENQGSELWIPVQWNSSWSLYHEQCICIMCWIPVMYIRLLCGSMEHWNLSYKTELFLTMNSCCRAVCIYTQVVEDFTYHYCRSSSSSSPSLFIIVEFQVEHWGWSPLTDEESVKHNLSDYLRRWMAPLSSPSRFVSVPSSLYIYHFPIQMSSHPGAYHAGTAQILARSPILGCSDFPVNPRHNDDFPTTDLSIPAGTQ